VPRKRCAEIAPHPCFGIPRSQYIRKWDNLHWDLDSPARFGLAATMDKKLYTRQQQILLELLRELRQGANLRQQDVADLIEEPQSFVVNTKSANVGSTFSNCARFATCLGLHWRNLRHDLTNVSPSNGQALQASPGSFTV
jgi:hypothetical protein